MIDEKYLIGDSESDEEFQYRISGMRVSEGLTWDQVAKIINDQTGNEYTESKYRKDWKNYCAGYNAASNEEPVSEVSEIFGKKLELAKERMKLSDERVQINSYIRRLAREETIKEIATSVAESMNKSKILDISSPKERSGEKEAILCISDWHYGIECDNFWNKYNPEVAEQRIADLLQKAKTHCKENSVKKIHVVNLGDMIAGRIHYTLRLESRFDVITQTIKVSEILAEFLNNLAKEYDVEYYDCIDNHSRLEPNKKDAMELETLARIIPWYLRTRLGDAILVHDNVYGEDIITLDVLGHKILGVHGDKDDQRSVVDSLSMMTHEHYDAILTAHMHHFSCNEKNETLIISNGSLMGTDTYAKNLRLSSKPSQNLIILTEDCPAEVIYRITV